MSPSQIGEAKSISSAASEERSAKLIDADIMISPALSDAAEAKGGADAATASSSGSSAPNVAESKGVAGVAVASSPVAATPTRSARSSAESKLASPATSNIEEGSSPTTRSDADFTSIADNGEVIKKEAKGKSAISPPKQNLGAFHHLAPMRKPSQLEGKLGDIRKNLENGGGSSLSGGSLGGPAPWDPFGKPVLGAKSGLGKVGGLGKLEMKPLE